MSAIDENNADVQWHNLPVVSGDRVQLVELFQNLISNAIKFRHPDRDPAIRIGVTDTNEEWLVAVSDNGIGIGIEQQYQENIFVILKRLHALDAYLGTGLGLALCKRVIEHHHGRIWAESTPGQGTTIYCALPKTQQ